MTMLAELPPGELARSITGRDYLSWSQATSYLMCPRAFAFRYVEAVEPEFSPSSLVFGGALHDCLAEHHRAQLEGVEQPSIEEHKERVDTALSDAEPQVRFGASETHDSLLDLTGRMLEAFLASEFSGPQGKVVAIEEHCRGVLSDDLPPIEGYVDLITLHDGELTITDYKSSRTAWTESKVRENAGQLLLYAMLQSDGSDSSDGCSDVKLQFVTLTKAKKPVVEAHPVIPTEAQREATVTQLEEIWRGISAGSFPARPGWQCATCPFGGRCEHKLR